MTAIPVTAPAVEPVSGADMGAYLRLDGEEEAGLVAALIKSARLTIEAASGCVLIEQGWKVIEPRPRGWAVRLPLAPLIAIDAVRALDARGAAAALAPGSYQLDLTGDPPRLIVDPHLAFERLEIELRAGFGAAPEAVPEPLRQAIRLLVAHWFENRGDTEGRPIPAEIGLLVAPFRRARL